MVEYIKNTNASSGGTVYIGGITGYSYDSGGTTQEIIGNYWLPRGASPENKIIAENGIGAKRTSVEGSNTEATAQPNNIGTVEFSGSEGGWPSITASLEWGTGDSNGSEQYWASLGSYGGDYPRLWFEN
jgi:hypothetical protein